MQTLIPLHAGIKLPWAHPFRSIFSFKLVSPSITQTVFQNQGKRFKIHDRWWIRYLQYQANTSGNFKDHDTKIALKFCRSSSPPESFGFASGISINFKPFERIDIGMQSPLVPFTKNHFVASSTVASSSPAFAMGEEFVFAVALLL